MQPIAQNSRSQNIFHVSPQAQGAAESRRNTHTNPGRGKVNARWSLDFVHDQRALGRRFRVLNVVDDVTREYLAAIPDTSISGKRVARELTSSSMRAASLRGSFPTTAPSHLECDLGLGKGSSAGMALDRTRQADAERLHLILQRSTRRAAGYDVDQIGNDIGMSRQMVERYMRFRDQMDIAVAGLARLRLVNWR